MKDEPSPYCVGSLARGYTLELSEKLFNSMEDFAKYSFNRSHSFCYAVVAYKTAWLSCYYPAEFAVANCTVNEDQEAITATLSLAKKRGIQVLPPDINNSGTGFTLDNGSIRYGLKAIKGIGSAVLAFLERYRKLDPVPFKDFDDYYNRIHDTENPAVMQLIRELRDMTGKKSPNPMKKDVEVSLILSGTFDYSELNRYKLLYHYIYEIRKDKEIKIMDTVCQFKDAEEAKKAYTRKMKLALEKHYMGSYISEHPLDPYPYASFDTANENEVIKTSGIVTACMVKKTKTGKDYMSIKFRPKDGAEKTANVFREKLFEKMWSQVKKNQIITITGKVSKKYNNINASDIYIAAESRQPADIEKIDISRQPVETAPQQMVFPSGDVGYGNIF